MGGFGRRRHRAYFRLSRALGLAYDDTHFGYFNAEQCRKALVVIEQIKNGGAN